MDRRAFVIALVLPLAGTAQADAAIGSLRLSAPSRVNGGPDRHGVSRLRIEVENTSTAPLRLRALSVKLRSRRVMDASWTTQTQRVPGGAFLDGEPDTGTRDVVVPPGRHTLIVRFESIAASAYHVHSAEVSFQVREGRSVARGVFELPVATSRRHARPRP